MLLSGPFRKEMSAGFQLTTNNRMELMAVCVALEALKFAGSDVVVYSDSKYVVDAAAAVNRRPTRDRRATVFLSKTFGVAGKSLI